MSYTPKNNFNLLLGKTGIGKRGFRKKILADVACCDNLKGYEYYGGFPLETSLEFSRDMAVHGGCPNFSWEVVNSVYFTFAHATTIGRTNTINADPTVPIDAEETAIVEDHCGHKLVFSILYCGGGISITPLPPIPPDPPDDPPYDPPWPPPNPPPGGCIDDSDLSCDEDVTEETIGQSDTALVGVTGFNRPFRWSVAGTGYSMASDITSGNENTLVSDHTACGMATITIKGCDDRVATCTVRGTTGHWAANPPNAGPGICALIGEEGTVIDGGDGGETFRVELIKGKYKQIDWYKASNYSICENSVEMDCLMFDSYCFQAGYPRPCARGGGASGETYIGCREAASENARMYYLYSRNSYEWVC
jgi:hypothetical protein